jgi:hypothetical protein
MKTSIRQHRLSNVDLDPLRQRYRGGHALVGTDIEHLRALNWRFHEVEALCLNEARRMVEALSARVNDPEDALTDFEIEATVTACLREDDRAWSEDEENILAIRAYRLTHGESMFCDGGDWSFENDSRIRGIGSVGWVFHDFHLHDHRSKRHPGKEWRALPVRDLMRIGRFWVDIQAVHQWNLAISPGS